MIEIPLTQGYTTIVDDCDADLNTLNWSVKIRPRVQYAQRNNKGTNELMHWVIMERILGRSLVKGEVVDHWDHDGLNNTRENLRLATQSQNIANSRLSRANTSGYKGVSWHKRALKWNAKIRINGHLHDLGCFDSPLEAAKNYNAAALAHFGEFALLNPIPDEVNS